MEMMDVSLMAFLAMIMSVYHFIGFVTGILTVKVSLLLAQQIIFD
jgi:hypothetical protein